MENPEEESDEFELILNRLPVPTDSIKICRTSILNQLQESHLVFCRNGLENIRWTANKPSKAASDLQKVLKAVEESGTVSRPEIARKTGLAYRTVVFVLEALQNTGFIQEGILNSVYYYRKNKY